MTTIETNEPATISNEPVMDCTDEAAVTAHFLNLVPGVVHSARLAADPRLSGTANRVAGPDEHDWFRYLHEAQVMQDAAGEEGGVGNPREVFHLERIRALVQAYAHVWGAGHGRTLHAEYAAQLVAAAEYLISEAITESLAERTTTTHHGVADRLHRAIDRVQAVHLLKVAPGRYTEATAYSNERFSTVVQAMADTLADSDDRALTVDALRSALDLAIEEAEEGGEPEEEAVTSAGPETDRPSGHVGSITTVNGARVYFHVPAWAESDPSQAGIPADRLEMVLADLSVDRYFPGPVVRVDAPFGIGGQRDVAESALCAVNMTCAPFADRPEERIPSATVAVLQDCVIDDLGPDEVAELAGKLRAQAAVLDQVAVDLAAARADWAANGQATA